MRKYITHIKSRSKGAIASCQCGSDDQSWCTSTLGIPLDANHSNRSQTGRGEGGRGNKGRLETLTALDVRKLESWQLEEAQTLSRDFSDRPFQPFYRCAVDPVRTELDERTVRDLLGFEKDEVKCECSWRSAPVLLLCCIFQFLFFQLCAGPIRSPGRRSWCPAHWRCGPRPRSIPVLAHAQSRRCTLRRHLFSRTVPSG